MLGVCFSLVFAVFFASSSNPVLLFKITTTIKRSHLKKNKRKKGCVHYSYFQKGNCKTNPTVIFMRCAQPQARNKTENEGFLNHCWEANSHFSHSHWLWPVAEWGIDYSTKEGCFIGVPFSNSCSQVLIHWLGWGWGGWLCKRRDLNSPVKGNGLFGVNAIFQDFSLLPFLD